MEFIKILDLNICHKELVFKLSSVSGKSQIIYDFQHTFNLCILKIVENTGMFGDIYDAVFLINI